MSHKINISNYEAVFFDLDGTILDTAKDLSYALGMMSEKYGIEKPGIEQVRNWIGTGALDLVEKSLTFSTKSKPDEKAINSAFHVFSKAYHKCAGDHASLYEGTQNLLVKLLSNQTKIACITNKPLESTDFYLQLGMISQFFTVICAGDKVKHKKPHPWPLLNASKLMEVDITQCLMIGDSKHDVEAAKSAGCDVIAVNYGYNNGEDIRDAQPNHVISSFNELL